MRGIGCKSYRQAVSRRGFLSCPVSGLLLPAICQAPALAVGTDRRPADTAVIQYWLNGAASHFETYDPKPEAPSEVRGPFHPISTSVPGVQICEALPLHAGIMSKVTLIRSLQHDNADHQHGMHWCQTGHDAKANSVDPFKQSSHPCSGSVTAMLRGPNHPGLPPYVLIGSPIFRGPRSRTRTARSCRSRSRPRSPRGDPR